MPLPAKKNTDKATPDNIFLVNNNNVYGIHQQAPEPFVLAFAASLGCQESIIAVNRKLVWQVAADDNLMMVELSIYQDQLVATVFMNYISRKANLIALTLTKDGLNIEGALVKFLNTIKNKSSRDKKAISMFSKHFKTMGAGPYIFSIEDEVA